MNKILLINPGHDDTHNAYKHKTYRVNHRDAPPVGLLYVASYLFEHGYDVEIVDTHIESNYPDVIRQKFLNNQYLFVGLTVIIGNLLRNAKEITQDIRMTSPDTPIVWGGIIPSILPEETLMEYKPDYIIRYEGEETALELAEAIEGNTAVTSIRGLSYLVDGKVKNNDPRYPRLNLDEYSIPKWELFGNYFNRQQVPYFNLIISSRGCSFNCNFCYKHSIDEEIRASNPSWRFRSAEHIIKEVDYIHNKTGATVFTFGDDNFFINKKRAVTVLDYFRKNGFYIEECLGHLNLLDDDLIDSMGGVVQTFIFSIETASHRLQKFINKNIELEQLPSKLKKLYDHGIVSSSNFIIGLPTEKMQDLRKNVQLMIEIKKINPFFRATAVLFLPLPKTTLFDDTEKIYSVTLPKDISSYEDANFWIKDRSQDSAGKKFRPWISNDYYDFLVLYGYVFNDAFKMNNLKLTKKTTEILENNHEIREMFKGIESVNSPNVEYHPYVLEKVLNNEKIDLVNALKDR